MKTFVGTNDLSVATHFKNSVMGLRSEIAFLSVEKPTKDAAYLFSVPAEIDEAEEVVAIANGFGMKVING